MLGWGGYWAWDPVENASFLPWLTGTAYLHSVMVQERRGMLRVWNLSLLCATFALTILGTFLTRSGVLDSVHAFTESSIGPVAAGLLRPGRGRERGPHRLAGRPPPRARAASTRRSRARARSSPTTCCSRRSPSWCCSARSSRCIVEAVNNDRISVGAPYFNRMTIPLGLMLLFLMAVAPVLPWRKASGELLRHRLIWPAWIGAATMVVGVAARRPRGWPRWSPSASAGSPPARPAARSCWPPAARAGGASSVGPTAAWSSTSAW